MNRLKLWAKSVKAFYWWVWTGHRNKHAARRAIECDAIRYGGRIIWRD